MLVSEILRIKGSTLFTADPAMRLGEAVHVMAEHDIGSLVVMEGGRLVGILTFRELLKVLDRAGEAMKEMTVGEVMQRDPPVARPGMDVHELRKVMLEHHARYIPVMDGATLLGVLSFHDVAKAVYEEQSFENRMLKSYIKNWPAEEETAAR
ncbi:MAG: CBS domain-containing protein [Casimicrobiaceae bacterium]|nr:CBS domain-containing protein [Casimicrobiaceae bacterium]MCX8098902.1 CBS domain-containing protein [Casimicrobiaceae bacterium]MDW8312208.1 CBS domain-containing protein [Burkholderiales bacterium]